MAKLWPVSKNTNKKETVGKKTSSKKCEESGGGGGRGEGSGRILAAATQSITMNVTAHRAQRQR